MESLLSFASSHPCVVLSVFAGVLFFLYALIGSISKNIADVKINKERCKRVDSAIEKGYEYVELDDMILQKHDENVKEKTVSPKQEKNDTKIINIVDLIKRCGGGVS